MIWKETLPGPCLVELRERFIEEAIRKSQLARISTTVSEISEPKTAMFISVGPPAAMAICHESREVAIQNTALSCDGLRIHLGYG
jgi:hypothetical protein